LSYSDKDVLQIISSIQNDWNRRHEKIQEWRDIRYGRDDVLATIPAELQATDFEYHSSELDDSINDLTAFLSAAKQTWTVNPARDRDQSKADDIEAVITEVFAPNGVLDREAGTEIPFSVWQNQIENGTGIYKFMLKRDFVGRMPKRRYEDDDFEGSEENPDYNPRSRKETREEKRQTRYRESDSALKARTDEHMEGEFAWSWLSVDPRNNGYFRITRNGKLCAAGEIAARPVTVLGDYEVDADTIDSKYVILGEPSDGNNQRSMVTTFEFWDDEQCYFGLVSATAQATTALYEAEVLKKWRHPYGRPPYYEAFGLTSTDPDLAYRWTGAFNKLISEIKLLNHLETMHFNAVHRGYFPIYYPVKDSSYRGEQAPIDTEQLIGVTSADMARQELPPGYKWEIMPSGFEPDLMSQLQAARERVESGAITAVLRGASPGSEDSGAKISLLINAAGRAISPFTRHHIMPMQDMAATMLAVNKRLKIDTHVDKMEVSDEGRTLVKALTLRAEDIISTQVALMLDTSLPVDEAAKQTQGLTLVQNKMRSYESVAPEYFGIGDPRRERLRIDLEGREQQLSDVAFQAATTRFLEFEPAIFREWFAQVSPVPPSPNTVGGGPEGSFGGASAMIGRGEAASPSATQVDGAGVM